MLCSCLPPLEHMQRTKRARGPPHPSTYRTCAYTCANERAAWTPCRQLTVSTVRLVPERESVAHQVEGDARHTRVEKVLNEDGHSILGPHHAGSKQRKPVRHHMRWRGTHPCERQVKEAARWGRLGGYS